LKTISNEYQEQLRDLHRNVNSFGIGGSTSKHYQSIEALIKKFQCQSVLDYGCGKGHFLNHVSNNFPQIKIHGYDVANEAFSELPEHAVDLTVCLDVLEHVEFGALAEVFAEIREKTNNLFFCSIACYPASKTLPDGRNAHITQMPFGFWFSLLSQFFRVDQFKRTSPGEAVFICRKLRLTDDWR